MIMIFFGDNERAWTTLSKRNRDSETKVSHDRDYEEFVLDFMFDYLLFVSPRIYICMCKCETFSVGF